MADNKKQLILEKASDIFLDKGFNGASIAQIAKQAGVAKSLVFHHFPSKEVLWRAVKEYQLKHLESSELCNITKISSLQAFIKAIVEQRFKTYEGNPNLAKLITWQQLERQSEKLKGTLSYKPDDWDNAITQLQEKNLLNKHYSADLIIMMLYGAISQAFFDHERRIYEDPKKLSQYKALLIDCLTKALEPVRSSSSEAS